MEKPLSAKKICGEDLLIAHLDLCGTKDFYSKFELEQQIERIEQVVSIVYSEIKEVFNDSKQSLYVHMYGDSFVIVEKQEGAIEDCARKFLGLMFKVQHQILNDSESLGNKEVVGSDQHLYMPTLSRALIKRGQYYGMIFHEFQTSIEDVFSNFSLAGGSAIVEMDKTLKGLPMGVYIDESIINESQIQQDRLIAVNGSPLRFVKPPDGFDFLRSVFSSDIEARPEATEKWVERLVESTKGNEDFKSKLIPWIDAIQGRRLLIGKRQTTQCQPLKMERRLSKD
jgi:hypothetical protein